ncbi:MAG: arsenite methyltransferase [Chloroflexi bacterium]|nr:arsenite methyltransferase [Chloroflexota bacterium]
MSQSATPDELREAIRERYASVATAVARTTGATAGQELPIFDAPGCCGPQAAAEACCGGDKGLISSHLYEASQLQEVPTEAALASLGCGNPTALAELRPGEVVLDLGSGGGIDVLLSARRVGPSGFVYGLDMTDEMLALAEQNRARMGAPNVQFLKGQIEQVPLPDQSVDVIISNCVINLSADKERVLREAFRVLKPGGRFAVSDVVVRGVLPEAVRRSVEAWAGCVAGALEEEEYRARLAAAGFVDGAVEVTRVYDLRALAESAGLGTAALAGLDAPGGALASAFIRARRP